MKFSPETVRGSCHGKCREISGEILLLLFPQETKLESAQNFSRRISRHFSRDVLQLQMPNFMAFFTLRTFVPEIYTVREGPLGRPSGKQGKEDQGILGPSPQARPDDEALSCCAALAAGAAAAGGGGGGGGGEGEGELRQEASLSGRSSSAGRTALQLAF